MEQRVAIVTGGLRGLGRAMAVGLAREGHNVVAVGHIDADIAAIEEETSGINPDGRILPLVADLRAKKRGIRRMFLWRPRMSDVPDLTPTILADIRDQIQQTNR